MGKHTESTQSEFEVTGVKLANFKLNGAQDHAVNSANPFELYEDYRGNSNFFYLDATCEGLY
jgi:hypothetical protein